MSQETCREGGTREKWIRYCKQNYADIFLNCPASEQENTALFGSDQNKKIVSFTVKGKKIFKRLFIWDVGIHNNRVEKGGSVCSFLPNM